MYLDLGVGRKSFHQAVELDTRKPCTLPQLKTPSCCKPSSGLNPKAQFSECLGFGLQGLGCRVGRTTRYLTEELYQRLPPSPIKCESVTPLGLSKGRGNLLLGFRIDETISRGESRLVAKRKGLGFRVQAVRVLDLVFLFPVCCDGPCVIDSCFRPLTHLNAVTPP